MDRGAEVRQTLINSAIHIVSLQGIQNATTKALAADSKLSEVYIYRYFKSKDDLLEQTFYALDKELMFVLKRSYDQHSKMSSFRMGFKGVFHDFWRFALGDKEKCSFFIQYYYSSYYLSHSEEVRKSIYQPLLDSLVLVFPKSVDPWHEINHMYDIAFAKLWRVIRGSLADSAETEEQVYREIRLVEARVLEAIDGAQA